MTTNWRLPTSSSPCRYQRSSSGIWIARPPSTPAHADGRRQEPRSEGSCPLPNGYSRGAGGTDVPGRPPVRASGGRARGSDKRTLFRTFNADTEPKDVHVEACRSPEIGDVKFGDDGRRGHTPIRPESEPAAPLRGPRSSRRDAPKPPSRNPLCPGQFRIGSGRGQGSRPAAAPQANRRRQARGEYPSAPTTS